MGDQTRVLGILHIEQVHRAEVERSLLGWIEPDDVARYISAAEKRQRVEATPAKATACGYVEHGHLDIAEVVAKRGRGRVARDRKRVLDQAHSFKGGAETRKSCHWGMGV